MPGMQSQPLRFLYHTCRSTTQDLSKQATLFANGVLQARQYIPYPAILRLSCA